MAVTGPNMGAGWSGFWQMTGDFNPYTPFSNQSPANGGLLGWRSKLEWQIAKLADKQQFREIKALLFGLIGAVSGSNVTKTYSRVQGASASSGTGPFGSTGVGDLGGLVPIEIVTAINRNTTAADITYLKSLFNTDMLGRGLTYAADASGIGAGFGGKGSQSGW